MKTRISPWLQFLWLVLLPIICSGQVDDSSLIISELRKEIAEKDAIIQDLRKELRNAKEREDNAVQLMEEVNDVFETIFANRIDPSVLERTTSKPKPKPPPKANPTSDLSAEVEVRPTAELVAELESTPELTPKPTTKPTPKPTPEPTPEKKEEEDNLPKSDLPCVNKALLQLDKSKLKELELVIHRNGEPEPSGSTLYNRNAFQTAAETIITKCHGSRINKFKLEAILTAYFQDTGISGYCDMGKDQTTAQPDSRALVKQPDGSLPCRFYTREGQPISSLKELVELSEKAVEATKCEEDDQTCPATTTPALHIYAVPAGRVFMFAPSFVGEQFHLDHVKGAVDDHNTTQKMVLEVISVNPRVFEIYHFFSPTEAAALIDNALTNTSDVWGLHRSPVGGTSDKVNNLRTSDNAWDVEGVVAMDIKRRCMKMLGFEQFWHGHTDGLQILRYQNAQAYTQHYDYLQHAAFDDPKVYDSSGVGVNRFATILLYMTDLGDTEGGETLFTQGQRPGSNGFLSDEQAVAQLRESGDPNLAILQQGSWEETMTAMCRSRLSIQPRAGRAVLFYNQYPDGKQDFTVEHGGCPVLNGTKWAANLWVWNGVRPQ